MSEILVKPKLFNTSSLDTYDDQHFYLGNPTGISNLNSQRYNWVAPLYRTMSGNYWLPQKVSLAEDRITIKRLTEDEDKAVRDTLSFLIFLDSFQTNNLPNIVEYITNPGVKNLMHFQTMQEVIHSETYQYGLESLYPSIEREEIYNRWRDNELLKQRNKFVADIAEQFVEEKSEEAFIRVLCANLALEGVFFYQGFNFFDQLASRKKLVQWDKEIDYIRRDELTHMGLFVNMIREIPQHKVEKHILEVFEKSGEWEIQWCKQTYGNRILGITESSSEQYVKWLVNDRLKRAGFGAIYDSVDNPYAHLDNASKEGSKRENFFESGAVTSYDTADSVDGWDEL